jgi:flagellar FliJ protein
MREVRVGRVIGGNPRRLEPERAGTGPTRARAGGVIEQVSNCLRGAGVASMTRVVGSPHFTFRLERVRALRERAEDQAQEDYASSLAHRLEGVAMLRAAAEHRDRARSEARPGEQFPMTGAELLHSEAWLHRLERTRQAAELELDRREAEVDARHTALVHAARERHALDRLHERRRAEHALETSRREGAELDELALAAHRRRTGA